MLIKVTARARAPAILEITRTRAETPREAACLLGCSTATSLTVSELLVRHSPKMPESRPSAGT